MLGPGRRAWPALAVATLLLWAPGAQAHPLGNFSVNHQTRVKISRDRIDLLYILDQAEIPTFQERKLSGRETLRRKAAEVRANLRLVVDGRRVQLRVGPGATIAFPRGQGGLQTTRVELPVVYRVRGVRRVEIRDLTFLGRVGWTDVVARARVAARQSARRCRRADPTNRLTTYRGITLQDVTDQRVGRFAVQPGKGTLAGPRSKEQQPPPAAAADDAPEHTSDDGLTGLFEDASAGQGVFVLMLLAAFGWGALHALSPGHGKAMVAAYLVGTRGAPRHAVALGGIVTVTHTIGVFALGLVTLLLSQWILPEDLYPWLNLASGLLIVAVGLSVLGSRVRWARRARSRPHARSRHTTTTHPHDHTHDLDPTWKGLTGMGISAGIIPCPSALVGAAGRDLTAAGRASGSC